MTYLIELLISGLSIGAIYGLIAMGFAIIYKSTGLVNFAQGEIAMIVAYVAWTIASHVSGTEGMSVASALSGYTFGFWALVIPGVLLFVIAPLIQWLDASTPFGRLRPAR